MMRYPTVSLICTVIVPKQKKILFTQFRILLTFLIRNENFNTQLNEKMCVYATQCVKKLQQVPGGAQIPPAGAIS